jgi:hypothetical protein
VIVDEPFENHLTWFGGLVVGGYLPAQGAVVIHPIRLDRRLEHPRNRSTHG